MTQLPRLATRDRVTDAVLIVLCGICQAAAAGFAAFATRDAFAALHAGQALPLGTMVELAVAGVFAAVALYYGQRMSEALGQSYANALRQCLFRKIATLPKARHEERRLGALSLRFVGDLSAARLWFGNGLPDILTALVVVPGAMVILFALDPRLAPAGIAPLGAALILVTALAWQLGRRHRTLRKRRASIAISMIERIALSPELDQMGRTKKELRGLSARGEELRADAIARRSRAASLQAILQAGLALAGLSLLWRAGQIGAAPGTVAASLAVLALLVLPLQHLATAWDRYCAWHIAREKALNLMREPEVKRRPKHRKSAVEVEVCGSIEGHDGKAVFARGTTTHMSGPTGSVLARHIAGLDQSAGLIVRFDGEERRPRSAYIGDTHVGLQGSLRRAATLLSAKRPGDDAITDSLKAYGLGHLLDHPGGLDSRIAEGGRDLSSEDTIRLDLARAELGQVDLLVIDSMRFRAISRSAELIDEFTQRNEVTLIVTDPSPVPDPAVFHRSNQR